MQPITAYSGQKQPDNCDDIVLQKQSWENIWRRNV